MHQSAMPQRHVRGKVIGKLHTLTSALDGGKKLKVLPALHPGQQSPRTMGQLSDSHLWRQR
jgi:hypothetical protein